MATLASPCLQHAEALRLFMKADVTNVERRVELAKSVDDAAEPLRHALKVVGHAAWTRPMSLTREPYVAHFLHRDGLTGRDVVVFDRYDTLADLRENHPGAVPARHLGLDGRFTLDVLTADMSDTERQAVQLAKAQARDASKLRLFGSVSADACGDERVDREGDKAAREAVGIILAKRRNLLSWQGHSQEFRPEKSKTKRRSTAPDRFRFVARIHVALDPAEYGPNQTTEVEMTRRLS